MPGLKMQLSIFITRLVLSLNELTNGSSISTVETSEVCAPPPFSLLNVILNKHLAYLSCSCYTHMNNL